MHKKLLFPAVIVLGMLLVIACARIDGKMNSAAVKMAAAQPQEPEPEGARRITIDELEKLMEEGKAFVVDVRNKESYDAGHIPGAHLIPEGEILNHLKDLPRDKTIVTYCS